MEERGLGLVVDPDFPEPLAEDGEPLIHDTPLPPQTDAAPMENLYYQTPPNVITLKTDQLFAWARKSSLWPLTYGIACCAIEMIGTYMANYDFDRFGVVTWPSPRQSDVMIVAGTVNRKMAKTTKLLWEQMPMPKWCIAMGSCAVCGGPFYPYMNVIEGVDKVIPVDVYVPGCPPRPEALIDGILKLQEKIMAEAKEGVWHKKK